VEEHAVAGRQQQGYAVGHVYPGAGAETVIEAGAVIRAGATLYAGTEIGENTVVGHRQFEAALVSHEAFHGR
jgi:acetyltransferase-like isoleucine patch superfamily enzyme